MAARWSTASRARCSSTCSPGVWTGERRLPLGALVGLVFVISGLAFKMAAVPFHMWTPDVYEGAPSPVTAFMAGAPKVAAMGLMLRVLMEPFGAWAVQWQQVVVVLALASMALGAFAAIGQLNIKRLMAYSGIGQYRLRAGGCRCRHARPASTPHWSTWRSTSS